MRAGRCFGRPWWWAALGLLLLNDHVLKGLGLLPGWLTGKLSDFAGLIVAPALLVSVLRANRLPARAACFAAVAIPFAAIKLSEGAARALESLLEVIGISWRIWSDPTDLLALAVLVPLWAACRPGRAPPIEVAPTALHRSGLVLGALACLATSEDYQATETAAYLVNSTLEGVEVRLSRLPEPADCSALDPARGWNPSPQDFAFETSYRLEPQAAAPLDRPGWHPTSSQDGGAEAVAPPCAAVLLEIPALPPTVVFWGDLPRHEIDVSPGGRDLDSQGVYIESAATRLFITGSEYVRTFPIGSAE